MIKKLAGLLVASAKKDLVLIFGLFVFLVIGGITLNKETQSSTKSESEETTSSPDTYIPKGYVLVPVELTNMDSIQSMMGDFAIVDLYRSNLDGKSKGQKVGRKLRLLRAPLNPKTFGVLVPESEAAALLASAEPLWAVLQNKKDFEPAQFTGRKNSRVQYYSGGEK